MKKLLAMVCLISVLICFSACKEEKTDEESVFENISQGIIEGNVYENKFNGLGIELPGEWKFSSREEMDEMTASANELLRDDLKEQLSNANVVYDAMATVEKTGSSLAINMEKVTGYNEQGYLNAAMSDLGNALSGMGYSINSMDIVKTQIAGEEHFAIGIDGVTTDESKFSEMIICKQIGDCMVIITICMIGNADCGEVVRMFYAV